MSEVTLYDARGNPLPRASARRPITREVAVVSLRDRWDEYPADGLTPARLASILREADQGDLNRQMELFSQLEEKNARIAAALQTRKLAVAGLPWEVTPAAERGRDPTPDQVRQAEYVDEVLRELGNWDDALLDALDALGKGYSVLETLWRVSEGDVWVGALEWKDPRKFVWDPETLTELRLITEHNAQGVPLSAYPGKFVVHRYRARSGGALRAGLLRTCAWMHLLANYGWKDWAVFAELFGQPLRLGKYERGAPEAEREALMAAVRALGTDAAGIISKDTEIELLEAAQKTGAADLYERLIRLAGEEITIAILGQTATTQGTAGKLGNEEAQNAVRQDLKAADARSLAKTLREQLVVPLVNYQFGPQDRYPGFRFLYEPAEDLAAASAVDRQMIEAGVPVAVSQMRAKYGYTEPGPKDEVVVPWQWRGGAPGGAPQVLEARHEVGPCPTCAAAALAALSQRGAAPPAPGQAALDALVELLPPAELQAQAEGLVKPLLTRLAAGVPAEELLGELAAAYPGMDTAALEEALARLVFVAELAGVAEARGEA